MINERLRTLIVLDAEKNYTKTAQICKITQPAVTQHIQALEAEFGIVIFERIGKDLITTPEGQILVKNAKRLAAINKNITKEINASLLKHQRLDIGITLTASDYFVPEILNVFKEKFPDMRFNFHTDVVDNIIERLKFSELDFAIIDGDSNYKSFDSHFLSKDELILIVSKDHPFTKLKEVSLEMLKEEKLILRHKRANTRVLFEKFLSDNQETLNSFDVILEVENTSLIRHLVRDGYGISIMPKSVCINDLNSNRLKEIKIKDFNIERGIYLIHHKKNENNVLINEILKLKSLNYINKSES